MLHRHEASVEEGRVEGGRVDDGNKRGRDGAKCDCYTMKVELTTSSEAMRITVVSEM